ncbi:MAG TPA: methionyl-tRNA formyltransferase [Candidatus Acidoferrales bacterium]|jgi:methionyl-tRNA formyltransferase|nr:methionyl-tRNA formyltransferase [Candidatus Acidoferrales bacterium]
MRIVFCGTPQFAVPSLKYLLTQNEFEIASVYTQPDRPRGRGQEISFSPVKEVAVAAGLEVMQPEKVRAPEVEEHLRKLAPDAIVIIAYGQIIPARLLPIPRLGWINLHASLLPKYRGAAPIQWAIASGETVTGNTTMRIDAGMDTGEMLVQEELRIGAEETATELAGRLAEMGAPLMAKTLRGLAKGELTGQAQNHAEATLAPMLKREDGRIEWARTAKVIYDRMRGFAPWPGAYTEFRGRTWHLRGKPLGGAAGEPGTILVEKDRVRVVCGGGSQLEVVNVKQEGRKEISAGEFVRGARVIEGERFGK